MSNISILSDQERENFDKPPTLPVEIRNLCFTITKEIENHIKRLRTKTNKVGFLLQYGYFKACKRFFPVDQFEKEIIKYVAKSLGLTLQEIDLKQYQKRMAAIHQTIILSLLGYQSFNNTAIIWLKKDVARSVKQLTEPRQIFSELLQQLHNQKIEVPSYYQLTALITEMHLEYENKLLLILKKKLLLKQKKMLDELLDINKDTEPGILRQCKTINQSTKPKAIEASVRLFTVIKEYFYSLLSIIESLNLSPNSCIYYATWLKKAKISQIKQFPDKNKTYLHLIAFIQHQFFIRQDAFVDILMKNVQATKNAAIHQLNEIEQSTRVTRRTAIQYLTKSHKKNRVLIDEITTIVKSDLLTDTGKVKKITALLEDHSQKQNLAEQKKVELFEKSLERIEKNKDYFDILEGLSVKLQNRISDIVQALVFDEKTSDKTILKAIQYFAKKKGKVGKNAPIGFLKKDEKAVLTDEKNNFKVSLYKILLFIHLSDAIRWGEINLKYSYRYLSVKNYLIDEKIWKKQSNELLKQAGLESFSNFKEIIDGLKQNLEEKYHYVNQRFIEGRNPYLSITPENDIHVSTPPLDEKETKYIAALLAQNGYVPIFQVLSEIDSITQLTHCLKHHSIKHVKRRPYSEVFIAGIIGLGSNIGIPKMAQISTGVNEHTLSNTVNWYFSRKTLSDANDRMLELINKLSLSKLFVESDIGIHGSSDGQKVTVGVESLLANYSFKYFGHKKGVSVYTFIDERQALFHSLVMSASEREASYVIDGLLENNVTKVNIHSTDSHGYTETIFAITHFMGISFAPRIKK